MFGRFVFFLICIIVSCPSFAQVSPDDLLKGFQWREIGPANQGGRITDIEARADDFTQVYIAVASGGVWKSENAGTTWSPIFEDYETASIGDIALDPNDPKVIWVGTGEANNRNSVSWGNGIYVSRDGGDTFENKGLENTQQIARVLVNPDNSDDVCVCAIGHLWGYSGERGLFRTRDGGETWEKLSRGLPDDGKTGCTDIVRDSKNPNTLYAAFYHRLRKPWHFHSGGGEGGIYKSTNGGRSWTKLTNGLPTPTGRIGLAIYEQDPDIVMALVEAEQTDTLAVPGSGVYRTEDGGKNWTYVNTYNNRPFYYSQIRINPHDDQRVYLLTTRFMVSEDGGKTLRNGSEDQEVHGDFHALWHDPGNKDRYYLGADKGLSITHDHGAHFTLIDNLPIAQFYRITYDMRQPYYVYGGLQDNGSYATASFSRDARGILSDSNWKMHWGDGQNPLVNPYDWTDMYSSTENGSYTKYDPKTRRITRISPNPTNTLNFRDYFPADVEDMESALRYNWSAPMVMSSNDPGTIYVAGNHVFKSIDKGKTWTIISPDLSTNHSEKRQANESGGITPDNTGAETHCAVFSLSVSPVDEDVIWAGTDDGNVQVTVDGGGSWRNVRSAIPDVPDSTWVSRVEASHFSSGRAYVSFDGHRQDAFAPWIFVTDDGGESWTRITGGMEDNEVVRVIREDLVNENLLFAGTETGVWFSLDRGSHWQRLRMNMPTVSVYDLKIHPRDHDLIAGTHGRGIWILDDISPLQQWNTSIAGKDAHIFAQKPAILWENVSRGGQRGHFWFAGDNPAYIDNTSSLPRAAFETQAVVTYFLGEGHSDSLDLHITTLDGNDTRTIKVAPDAGIHRVYWDRTFEAKPYSSSDKDELDDIWASILDSYGGERMERLHERFEEAGTPREKREILGSLTGGYLNFPIPERFTMPMATPGSYRLELQASGKVERGILQIMEDPLLKE